MIPILSAQQTREADAYTMKHEPVSGLDLMERAAAKCYDFIARRVGKDKPFLVFCGTGNNGGDGLVMARKLHEAGYHVRVYIVRYTDKTSSDFDANAQRLKGLLQINNISSNNDFPPISPNDQVLDALLGTGLSRPPQGLLSDLIQHLNRYSAYTISIDMPSGLYADRSSVLHKEQIINAKLTLTFQLPKLAFFFPENAKHVGEFRALNIGLHHDFIASCKTTENVIEPADVSRIVQPRKPFSHKGTYGHALIVAGSYGKSGAAVMSARACIRSGVGLLTVQAPRCSHLVLQTTVPEAMLAHEDGENFLLSPIYTSPYNAVGIGPGLGKDEETVRMFKFMLQSCKVPLVVDADALNILSENPAWLDLLPAGSILTPHPKEFERLFGKTSNDFERMELLRASAIKHNVCIALKGRYSLIASPGGNVYINTTGNPGMATGGSGDVLTGIITGLLAQGLNPLDACMAGVCLHGLAGDMALETHSEQSLIATDIIEYLGRAFQEVAKFRE